MGRLTLETLARLVDEAPNAEEQALLDADPVAAGELEALRAQRRALAALPSVLPTRAWDDMKAGLRSAGLIRRSGEQEGSGAGGLPSLGSGRFSGRGGRLSGWSGRFSGRRWRQAAAAMIVFAGGAAAGWTAAPSRHAAESGGNAAFAAVEASASPQSLDEARSAVQAAERDWMRAHDAYWQLVETRRPDMRTSDPAARLAALEALVAVGQAAVAESPSDAYFNGFLLTSLAQRQQTLRQMSRAGWY